MNTVRQVFYDTCNYASLFLVVLLTKIQAFNNQRLTLCQHGGPQHSLPVWNRALQWTLITVNSFCARMIVFLTPISAILQTKDPTVVSSNLKRLPSDFQHIPKPFVTSQPLTDTNHFKQRTVNKDQLNEEILNHPSLHHVVQPPEPHVVLASNTDHFEHQTVNTDQLSEEIRNHPPLHHVEQPPEPQIVLASDTDHFEHQTVNTDQLSEEIRNHPPLHHVEQPPEPQAVLASDTDHFEHQTMNTDQLSEEIRNHPPLHHVEQPPEPQVVLASNTDHFEHQTVNTDQLSKEIRNHPPLHHVEQPPEPQVVLESDTDHFEHVDVETTERLLEELTSVDKGTLNHVSELPARVAQTDIEFLHASLEAHKV